MRGSIYEGYIDFGRRYIMSAIYEHVGVLVGAYGFEIRIICCLLIVFVMKPRFEITNTILNIILFTAPITFVTTLALQ